MDKTIALGKKEMEEMTILPIYERVYSILQRRTTKRLFVHEFYKLIEKMRLKTNGNAIFENIKRELIELGCTEKQAKELSQKIQYTRYSRLDSKDIEKQMIELGWIKRDHNYISIK
jgi:hypothetical protein